MEKAMGRRFHLVVALVLGCSNPAPGDPSGSGGFSPPPAGGYAALGGRPLVSFGLFPFNRVEGSNEKVPRADYNMVYESPSSWSEVSSFTDDFEIYYEQLQHQATTAPYNLDAFVEVLRQEGKTVTLQTGDFVMPTGPECPPGTGAMTADAEFVNIQQWLAADGGEGTIDRILVDNAYWKILTADHLIPLRCPSWSSAAKVDYITTELAAYLHRMQQHLPGVEVALTDALAAFAVVGPGGTQYPSWTPVSQVEFTTYIDQVLVKSSHVGVTLSEFTIDFWDAVEHDVNPWSSYILDGADYGRILGVESALRARGVPVGMYVNAFPEADPYAPVEHLVEARQAVKDRSRGFLAGYQFFGGQADVYRYTWWHDIPDLTGPETSVGTSMNVIRDGLRDGFSGAQVGAYLPSGGSFRLLLGSFSNTPQAAFTFGVPQEHPVAGDWDGDGVASIGVFDSASAYFYLRNSNSSGYADLVFSFGIPGWLPVAGDWDGDGDDSVGLYDPSRGIFFLKNSNTGGYADLQFTFGPANSTWIPIAGDWDGDGVDTVGLFDPGVARFYLRNSNTTGYAHVTFLYGVAGWKPVAGDWNGDGTATVGLYAPASKTFFLRNSNSSGYADLEFHANSLGSDSVEVIAGKWRR